MLADVARPPSSSYDQDELVQLVALVHEGVFEPHPWSRFLRALRTRLDAGYANIIFRRAGSPDEGLIEWVDAEGDTAGIRAAYFDSFKGKDPLPYFRMEPGRVFRTADLMGGGDYREQPFFRDFLQPYGFEHMLMLRVVAGGHQAWMTVTQPAVGEDFPRSAADLCTRLAPHFATALRSYGAIETAKLTRAIRDRVMSRTGYGCVTIDARRIVIHGDASLLPADRKHAPVDVDPAGKVRLASAAADRKLGLVLAQIDDGQQTDPVTIASEEGSAGAVLVVPLEPSAAGASGASAAIFFQLPGLAVGDAAAFRNATQIAFGLSPAEAELATYLAQGASIVDAADAIGLTVESARTYSKRVFAKTGTSGQADLIRRLLRSIALLG